SYTMVEEYGSENEKIVGTVIIIEAIEAETNKKVLIVRANNPQENIIRRIDIEKLVAEELSAFIKLAKERGAELLVLPLDKAGASSSNRSQVSRYYSSSYAQARKVSLVQTPETNFNEYDNWNTEGRYPVVEVWNSLAPQAAPFILFKENTANDASSPSVQQKIPRSINPIKTRNTKFVKYNTVDEVRELFIQVKLTEIPIEQRSKEKELEIRSKYQGVVGFCDSRGKIHMPTYLGFAQLPQVKHLIKKDKRGKVIDDTRARLLYASIAEHEMSHIIQEARGKNQDDNLRNELRATADAQRYLLARGLRYAVVEDNGQSILSLEKFVEVSPIDIWRKKILARVSTHAASRRMSRKPSRQFAIPSIRKADRKLVAQVRTLLSEFYQDSDMHDRGMELDKLHLQSADYELISPAVLDEAESRLKNSVLGPLYHFNYQGLRAKVGHVREGISPEFDPNIAIIMSDHQIFAFPKNTYLAFVAFFGSVITSIEGGPGTYLDGCLMSLGYKRHDDGEGAKELSLTFLQAAVNLNYMRNIARGFGNYYLMHVLFKVGSALRDGKCSDADAVRGLLFQGLDKQARGELSSILDSLIKNLEAMDKSRDNQKYIEASIEFLKGIKSGELRVEDCKRNYIISIIILERLVNNNSTNRILLEGADYNSIRYDAGKVTLHRNKVRELSQEEIRELYLVLKDMQKLSSILLGESSISRMQHLIFLAIFRFNYDKIYLADGFFARCIEKTKRDMAVSGVSILEKPIEQFPYKKYVVPPANVSLNSLVRNIARAAGQCGFVFDESLGMQTCLVPRENLVIEHQPAGNQNPRVFSSTLGFARKSSGQTEQVSSLERYQLLKERISNTKFGQVLFALFQRELAGVALHISPTEVNRKKIFDERDGLCVAQNGIQLRIAEREYSDYDLMQLYVYPEDSFLRLVTHAAAKMSVYNSGPSDVNVGSIFSLGATLREGDSNALNIEFLQSSVSFDALALSLSSIRDLIFENILVTIHNYFSANASNCTINGLRDLISQSLGNEDDGVFQQILAKVKRRLQQKVASVVATDAENDLILLLQLLEEAKDRKISAEEVEKYLIAISNFIEDRELNETLAVTHDCDILTSADRIANPTVTLVHLVDENESNKVEVVLDNKDCMDVYRIMSDVYAVSQKMFGQSVLDECQDLLLAELFKLNYEQIVFLTEALSKSGRVSNATIKISDLIRNGIEFVDPHVGQSSAQFATVINPFVGKVMKLVAKICQAAKTGDFELEAESSRVFDCCQHVGTARVNFKIYATPLAFIRKTK
ncbi:MAG: hypothetical protein KBC84_09385, partial [Proteobacteria bacterium]|nr:hypothetical protein [Pseudomonadota bacterium]